MVADYSFDVKNIGIWVPTFFKHNNSFIATVASKKSCINTNLYISLSDYELSKWQMCTIRRIFPISKPFFRAEINKTEDPGGLGGPVGPVAQYGQSE